MNERGSQPSKIWILFHWHVPASRVQLVKRVQPLIGELVLLQEERDLLLIIAKRSKDMIEHWERLGLVLELLLCLNSEESEPGRNCKLSFILIGQLSMGGMIVKLRNFSLLFGIP